MAGTESISGLKIVDHASANFSNDPIEVEFLVLHYTACDLERTLEIFSDPARKVCAHFVLDLDGTVYDLGKFWKGPARRGAHAGESRFQLDGREWQSFNQVSIGIETINFNGNLLEFTEAQYASLQAMTTHLMGRFPALRNPARVVGHEHIAGFRGKVDPGLRFDWPRYFRDSYPGKSAPERFSVMDAPLIEAFLEEIGGLPPRMSPDDWPMLSARLEAWFRERQNTAP